MSEREHKPEISEQFQLDLAYFNFIRLAEYFGRSPKIHNDESEESKKIKQNMKTLSVNVPSSSDSELPFSISGIDYGVGSNTIELYYQIADRAAKIMLIKAKKSGIVHIKQATSFHFDEQSRASTPSLHKNFKPDMEEVCQFLQRAEGVLEEQKRARLISRFDKPKLSFRQKLSKRMQDLLK
ncbi:MAG: hypothetical protein AAB702_00745 [Patescibacteria group bacterium]